MTEEKIQEVAELKMNVDLLNAFRVNIWKEFYNTLNQEYGQEKAIELSSKAITNAARPLVINAINAYGVEKNAKGAAGLLRLFHGLEGVTGDLVEATEKLGVIKENSCPCQNNLPGEWCMKVSDDIMALLCEELNPKITSYHKSYLTAGDNSCEIVFELKD